MADVETEVETKAKTIASLPPQPLPASSLPSPVFVTIWLVGLIIIFLIFRKKLKRGNMKRIPEDFRLVKWGTFMLCFWYIFIVTDRWLHWAEAKVSYGYVVAGVFWTFFRVGSSLMLHWATYQLVWAEIEGRFPRKTRGWWWLAAKLFFFLVGLVSLYYVILNLALGIVWLQFLSLNVIGDVASRRDQFEMAMVVLLFVFGLLTLGVAGMAVVKTRVKDGVGLRENKTQLFLLLATLFLTTRALTHLILVAKIFSTPTHRTSKLLADDVSHGLLTILYLAALLASAHFHSKPSNPGTTSVNAAKSRVRDLVLLRLDEATNGARNESPP